MRIGITFVVYGEGSDPERIIDADEWDPMSRGLEQWTKVLKYFLTDICAEWGMMRAGMIDMVRVSADEFYVL